jgi:hypothetical protein
VDAARDKLLAGARLAHDQHVDVGVGDLLDRVEHFVHGRAAADHVVEAVGSLDLAAEQLVLGSIGARSAGVAAVEASARTAEEVAGPARRPWPTQAGRQRSR